MSHMCVTCVMRKWKEVVLHMFTLLEDSRLSESWFSGYDFCSGLCEFHPEDTILVKSQFQNGTF